MSDAGKIIWFIEHISRELDVACVISFLVERAYKKRIAILPYYSSDYEQITKVYQPELVLLPYCYSIHDPSLKHYLFTWTDAIYFNLAWEQIFYKANLEYKAPRDELAKKYVIHHAWSYERSEFLLRKGVPSDHIFINGHPAYKLYDKPYRDIFVNRRELAKQFKINPRKKWIFFPENYSWYFYSDHNLEDIIKHGQDRSIAYLMRDYCGLSFKEVIGWLDEAAKKFDDEIEIILRPRPAVNLSYFTDVVNKLLPTLIKNIHIMKDYSVREWILASDVVISSFSTSLIEAAIAKKPIYMLEPYEIPSALKASWYDYVKKIKKKSDFYKICAEFNQRDINVKLYNWAKEEFFVNSDPIMGLVDYLGKFNKSAYTLKDSNIKRIIENSGLKLNSWGLINEKVFNILGSLKRNITGNSRYYRNDDQDKYMAEIAKKTKIYENFFKKTKLDF